MTTMKAIDENVLTEELLWNQVFQQLVKPDKAEEPTESETLIAKKENVIKKSHKKAAKHFYSLKICFAASLY
ncbi:hypothetical protein ACIFOT_15900 [Neobacillus sp. NRS-1170]|uniref:hypothetical protein n=1 Tax=Neobacillus sp. NRS-1170 TaxID=3233898 RepID=UPI003D266DC8